MIRINLLPTRAVRKQEAGRNQLILFVLVVLSAVGGNYAWYRDRDQANEDIKGRVKVAQDEIATLDRIIGEVKNITIEKQALEDKLKVLEALKKGRTGPVKMLDAMASAIPKNVWLRSMQEAQSSGMVLDGTALSNDDLAEFMKAMGNVVWTPDGMGRVVEGTRRGGTTSRVELLLSGQVKDVPVERVSAFFKDISLRRASQRTVGTETKVVDFNLTCSPNYSI
jgi:type IV pilus assembly protein PilN